MDAANGCLAPLGVAAGAAGRPSSASGSPQTQKAPPPTRHRGYVIAALVFAVASVAVVLAGFTPDLSSRSWLQAASELSVLRLAAPGSSKPSSSSCTCAPRLLSGVVDDCCCEFETVDALTTEALQPLLVRLVQLPFFKYFKVRLWCDCPFWPDDGMCLSRDCAVGECPEEELPPALRQPPPSASSSASSSSVDRTLDSATFRQWAEEDNPWTAEDETDTDEMTYVNLALNPERYTGYGGQSARRIWQAIYEQSCFRDGPNDTCTERRVLFRLISGLHMSITVHVAAAGLEEGGEPSADQLSTFRERIAKFPDRLSNLYFTFLFILRAATKAAPFLSSASYTSQDAAEGRRAQQLVVQLVASERVRAACPVPFDEGRLWRGNEGASLFHQLQRDFQNITLWGKLEMLGIAASLKILFSEDKSLAVDQVSLERNEVVALINTLWRLAEAIKSASHMLSLLNRTEDR